MLVLHTVITVIMFYCQSVDFTQQSVIDYIRNSFLGTIKLIYVIDYIRNSFLGTIKLIYLEISTMCTVW